MAKKIKRYDGEEGSYVSDDDLDQRVYSSRGTGAGLSDDDEEGGGLREVEYKPEPKVVSKPKTPVYEMQPEKESKSKATIAGAKEAIKHLTNTVNKAVPQKVLKQNVDTRPYEKVVKKDVDTRPYEKVVKKTSPLPPQLSRVATKAHVKELQSLKSGGSVRGHGIESRGKTKGRFV